MKRDTLAATQLPPPITALKCSEDHDNRLPTSLLFSRPINRLTKFLNLLIFMHSKILYIINVMSSHNGIALSHHDHHICPQFSPCFYFTSIKLMTRHGSILFTFGLHVERCQGFPIMFAGARAKPFQFD